MLITDWIIITNWVQFCEIYTELSYSCIWPPIYLWIYGTEDRKCGHRLHSRSRRNAARWLVHFNPLLNRGNCTEMLRADWTISIPFWFWPKWQSSYTGGVDMFPLLHTIVIYIIWKGLLFANDCYAAQMYAYSCRRCRRNWIERGSIGNRPLPANML